MPEISAKNALFCGFSRLRDARDFIRESAGHLAIAVAFGDFHTFIQLLERPWSFSLAEVHSDLSKDARVELSFFGGIHDGEFKRRDSRHDPGRAYHSDPARARLPLFDR